MTPTLADDDQFTELMAAFDEALAAGRADDFLARTPPPPELAERLQRAQACLRRLTESWPGHAATQPVRIGRFQIERELGRGGFGVVYLAFDPVLKRQVAVKVPRLEALATPELRQRFLREAELTASMDHPNIVPVYEAGQAGAVGYIASAYCPGPDLGRWLAERKVPLEPHAAASLVATLADALHYCHGKGILHRDLKPSNVLLMPLAETPQGADRLPFVPRLTDFGLAKLMEASLTETHSSVILGTPLYMAPEQAEGQTNNVCPATDVYALGAILYELLAGQAPFTGTSLLDVLARVREEEPRLPRQLRAAIPRDLETICLQCLRKEPTQRYSSAQELADDLRRHLTGVAIQARRQGMRDRLRAWARRPERIGEAGIVAFVNALCCLLANLASMIGIWTGDVHVDDPVGAVAKLLVIVVVFGGLQVFLGWQTLARRPLGIWGGVVMAPVLMLYVTGLIFGLVDTGGYYNERDRGMQLTLEAMAASLLLIQFVTSVLALIAHRARLSKLASSLRDLDA